MSEKDEPDRNAAQSEACEPPIPDFTTFRCKLSRDYLAHDVDVIISGVTFDLATTERRGASFGPASIRQSFANLVWEIHRWPWNFHVYDILGVIGYGDLCFDTADKTPFDRRGSG